MISKPLIICLFTLFLTGSTAFADTCPSQYPAPGWNLVGGTPQAPLMQSFDSAMLVPAGMYCAYRSTQMPGYGVLISPQRYLRNNEQDWAKDYKMAAYFCYKSITECTFSLK
jgi:hypothetical protein